MRTPFNNDSLSVLNEKNDRKIREKHLKYKTDERVFEKSD
jgi:hypothetical protein